MDYVQRASRWHAPMAFTPGLGGIPIGGKVLTLDGALPVEHLYPGDRIVTRSGARRLLTLRRVDLPAGTPIITVHPETLGGRPDRALWLLPQQKLRITDWRAKAIWGKPAAHMEAERLVDGTYIRTATSKAGDAVLQPGFETPEVLYVEGLEMLCGTHLHELA